jgi:Domain of unknown function (DUF4258)
MFEKVLQQMRRGVRTSKVLLTTHAYDEMNQDDLFVVDLENCILTGSIMTRQWDDDFSEWKYVIHGDSQSGEEMAVVAKLDYNHCVVIITTFRL